MKSECLRRITLSEMVYCFAALVFLSVSSSVAVAADPSSFAGEWISRAIEGRGSPNNDEACTAVSWTDRKIKLEQIPGNPKRFRGEWVRKYQSMWMGVHGETCRFPGETKFVDSHIAVLGWTLSGTYDQSSDSLHLSGVYNDCTGNVCPLLQGSAKDFNTELRRIAGDVVDADPTLSPEDQRHFIPSASEQQYIDQVMAALKPILELIDKGDFDGLYRYTDSNSRSNLSADQFRSSFKAIRAKTGQLVSRSSMNSMYANYSPLSKSPGQNAIVMNVVYFPGNARTIEFIFMVKESDSWKMNYYYLGGGSGDSSR